MTTTWTSGDVTLICGDCLEVLPTLAAGSVDIVLTSPPYNVGLKYATYDDNLEDEQFQEFNRKWLDVIFPCMADDSRAYIIVSDRMVFDIKPLAEQAGFSFGQLLTWCKPNLAGGSGRITGDWNFLTEHIMLFRKGKRTPMLNADGVNTHSFFVIPSPQTNWNNEHKEHPAQFPLSLPRKLMLRTPGDTVLDPFMGSCSVGVSCVQLGRKFIGIEIDPGYFEIAKKRIQQAQMQIRMDLPTPPPVPPQNAPERGERTNGQIRLEDL